MKTFIKSKEIWFLFFLTFIAMLIMACNTSPLFNVVGYDSGIFLTMGKMLLDGKTLYVDMFDHKGPIIFFINALGQFFIAGTLGVWLIELVFMMISVFLIYKIARKILSSASCSLLIPISYLAYMTVCFEDGNFTEEYSNLFCIISLYLWVNFIEEKKTVLSPLSTILLGICFTIVCFIRPNNAALIAAVILYLGTYTLFNDPKKLLHYMLYGTLGICIILIPLLLYHLQRQNLIPMLDALILHNLSYSSAKKISIDFLLALRFNLIFCLIILTILITGLICIKRKVYTYGGFLFINALFCFVCIGFSGNKYTHYLMIGGPAFILSLCILLRFNYRPLAFFTHDHIGFTKFFSTLLLSFLLALSTYGVFSHHLIAYKSLALELGIFIDSNDKNDVYGYNLDSKWLYINDCQPTYKYFCLQDWMALTSPGIHEDTFAYLMSSPPKWFVTPSLEGIASSDIKSYIKSHYTEIAYNETGYLYKLNTP